jgi:hypothetical protein
MKRKLLVFFLICVGFATVLPAQTARRLYSVKGFVLENETNLPVEMALVSLPDLNLWGTTDAKGAFTINRVQAGTTKLQITCLGYQTLEMTIAVERDIENLTLKVREENLKLNSVTVTATEVKSAINTSTRMDRQAIDHLQVINPTDIMSLLPGGKTVNPNLMTQSIFNIRGGDGNGSFGTAVEVDGVRLSSNSNLSSTTGIDTRNLAASNFESIEVITGVPSVEYGDMTSGLVIIRTKKGRSPFNTSVSLNPTTKQVSVSKGLDLKKERGILNINAEYAHAFQNPVSPYTTYFRNGYGLNYSNTFNREGKPVQFNVNIGGTIGRQDSKQDPDAYKDTYSMTSDNAFRFGTSVNWLINSEYITGLDLSLSASYKDDYSEDNLYYSYATLRPASNSTENGYFETNYLPAQFYNLKMIDSKSINIGANLKYTLNKRYGEVLNKIKAGIGWSTNGNIGKGEDYEKNLYPDGYRPRPYTDIPFMHNINAYIEDNVTIPIGKTTLSLVGGVRFESNIIQDMAYDNALSASPRFNGRYTLVEQKGNKGFLRGLSIRGGWGMMEKLPSFNILFPMDKYRDIMVYSKNYGTQNNYFYVSNTNVFRDYFNPELKWSRSRNMEYGIDANIGGIGVSLVYYNNKSLTPYITESYHVPYAYKKSDENFAVPNNPEFRVDRVTGNIYVKDKDNPSLGEKLIPTSVNDTLFITNGMQANGDPSTRQGLELTVDFGKVESIRTSFRFDARYSYAKEVSERLNSSYTNRPHSTLPANAGRSYEYAAFYLGGTTRTITYNGGWADGLTANLTATTHIPEIRMTVSLRVEGTIFNRSQNLTYYNGEEWAYLVDENGNKVNRSVYDQKEYYSGVWPVAYMGFDGVVKPFTQTEANDPRFAYLIGRSNTTYGYARDGNGAYFMSNISLTKEIGDLASLSFYVNNFTKSNPYLESWATGLRYSRNIGFAYGATLRIKF